MKWASTRARHWSRRKRYEGTAKRCLRKEVWKNPKAGCGSICASHNIGCEPTLLSSLDMNWIVSEHWFCIQLFKKMKLYERLLSFSCNAQELLMKNELRAVTNRLKGTPRDLISCNYLSICGVYETQLQIGKSLS